MNIQEDIRKQIVQELKINQAAQCSHIVVCYHSFYHNGAISLVLEYMDRGSLADVVRQVKTILEPYLAVVCKQVSGFCYSHQNLNEKVELFTHAHPPELYSRFYKVWYTYIMSDMLYTETSSHPIYL